MHIDWWTLALQTVNVLVLLWILGRFFFRPLMTIVAKRQAEAGKLLADAAAARDQATALRTDAERARSGMATERDRLLAEARKAADVEKATMIAQSSREIAKSRSEAEAALARDREAAEKAVEVHARDLSLDIARRLLARFPPDTAFAAFLEGLCREVQSLAPAAKAAFAAPAGDAIEVVTATPLPADVSSRVRGELARAFGADLPLRFRADAALIAGIELHGRNAIVRNNWRADLDRIGEELKRDEHRARS